MTRASFAAVAALLLSSCGGLPEAQCKQLVDKLRSIGARLDSAVRDDLNLAASLPVQEGQRIPFWHAITLNLSPSTIHLSRIVGSFDELDMELEMAVSGAPFLLQA